jgi:hypothetical protein
VLQPHYNRENNEVVELPVARQSIAEMMLSRKNESDMRIGSVSNSLLMLIAGATASLMLTAAPACAAQCAKTDLVEFEKMTLEYPAYKVSPSRGVRDEECLISSDARRDACFAAAR